MPQETKTKDVGGVTIRVRQLEHRAAMRGFVLACRVFGQSGVNLITDYMFKGMAETEAKSGKQYGADLVQAVILGLSLSDPDDVDRLASAMLVGQCSIKRGDGWEDLPADVDAAWVRIAEVFPDVHSLFRAVAFGLQVNYAPTLGEPSTASGSSKNEAEPTTPTDP